MTSKRTLSPAEQRQREQAALKHGLRAKSSSMLRVRNYRTTRLLTRLQEVLADLGRPIQEAELPASRAWAQQEVLASDLFAAIQAGKGGEKSLEQYLAVRRLQLTYANALGLTPAARAQLASSDHARRLLPIYQIAAESAQARLAERNDE